MRDGTFTDAIRRAIFIAATTPRHQMSYGHDAAWERLSRVAERITLVDGDRRTIALHVVKLPEER
jgi:hypothetical protein